MKLDPVDSTAISHIGYDPAPKQMQVNFRNGGKYLYANVQPDAHASLVGSKSVGKQFAAMGKVLRGSRIS